MGFEMMFHSRDRIQVCSLFFFKGEQSSSPGRVLRRVRNAASRAKSVTVISIFSTHYHYLIYKMRVRHPSSNKQTALKHGPRPNDDIASSRFHFQTRYFPNLYPQFVQERHRICTFTLHLGQHLVVPLRLQHISGFCILGPELYNPVSELKMLATIIMIKSFSLRFLVDIRLFFSLMYEEG